MPLGRGTALNKVSHSCVDQVLKFGGILTDRSKESVCLPVAKLSADGFDINALKLVFDYLQNCKQRIKIVNIYNAWK